VYIGTGQHQVDAWHCQRLPHVDLKTRMGMRRAQNHGMQCPARCDIGNVTSKAAQERIIFLAQDRLSEAESQRLSHGFTGKNSDAEIKAIRLNLTSQIAIG